MKEWFKFVGRNFAEFLPTFGSLIQAPSQRMRELVLEERQPLESALLFTSVAIAIGLVIQMPWLPQGDAFLQVAANRVAHKAVAIVLYAYVLYLILRGMGGRGGFDATLTGYLYVTSVIYLTVVVLKILKIGLLAVDAFRGAWIQGEFERIDS